MLHHLQYPENQHIDASHDYAFCSHTSCHITYFSKTVIFKQSQLAQFQTPPKLCYCFDISLETYQNALQSKTNQAENIKEFVIQQTKHHLCACVIKNPSGRCCLASFKQLESEYKT